MHQLVLVFPEYLVCLVFLANLQDLVVQPFLLRLHLLVHLASLELLLNLVILVHLLAQQLF